MNSLLREDTRQALYLIQQFLEKGIPLNDIYVEILTESMHRVGDLWHTARISVAEEHYCTSVTQMAMSQIYPQLFSSERKNRRILCACPGTELHEMGSRMVADLFENDGWDSTYLGAAVPVDAMLQSIGEQTPDLVALSVTMPQHLMTCRDLVDAIRAAFPTLKIAVGGKAFQSTHDIWNQWPVDLYTTDALENQVQSVSLWQLKSGTESFCAILCPFPRYHLVFLVRVTDEQGFTRFTDLYVKYLNWAQDHLQMPYTDEYSCIQQMNNQLINSQRALMKTNHQLKTALHEIREANDTISLLERDELTSLYRGSAFYQKVRQRLAAEPDTLFDLIALDVDRFKLINEVFGRKAGDQLLQNLALFLPGLLHKRPFRFRGTPLRPGEAGRRYH